MKRSTKIVLAIVVAVVVVVAIGAIAGLVFLLGEGRVPGRTVLEADFTREVIEYASLDPVDQLLHEEVTRTLQLVEALEKAAEDERVTALVARVGDSRMGFAQLQELRDAVLAFRAAGKKAVAYADTFGEFAAGNGGYYLASAFDEIYLQPSGDVGLTGLLAESSFLRGTFEKLDMEPRMDHRHEYKNAMNTFTETGFTDAHREALGTVIESIFDQMVRGIAEGRGMDEEKVRSLIDHAPFYGQEALEANLVDGLAYRDEVYERVKGEAGDDVELLYLERYRERVGSPYEEGETVALVYGVGTVLRGDSSFNPMVGQTLGGDTVAKALRDAIDDDDVAAILFRVDSPGGSYVASDTVWRETVRARQAGKPLIVSMGNVAGSGGYFVAMSADKIVAQPGTITGSIGVLAGKILDGGFWGKLGISFDEVHNGANATMWSSRHDYSEAEWQRFQTALDRIYEDFTTKVAEGRGLSVEKVQQIAKGRIWTGEDAKELGLVDELGGFATALALAREAAGLTPDAPLRLKLFPRPKSPWEILFEEGPDNSDEVARAMLRTTLETLRPAAELGARLGLLDQPVRVLGMPAVEIGR